MSNEEVKMNLQNEVASSAEQCGVWLPQRLSAHRPSCAPSLNENQIPAHASEVAMCAEQSVIGSILIDEKALVDVVDTLKPEHFYFEEFKEIYKAILELCAQGKSIDFVSVLKKLTSKGVYSETQIKQLLLNCAELVPSVSRAKAYAQTVIDSFKARELQKIGTKLAFDGVFAENATEIADEVMGELYELLSEQHKKRLQSIDSVGLQVAKSYKNTDKNSENRSQTGFPKLDEILKGMSAGNLIVLAARPKVGKTAFALSIAENVAKSGKTVAFYSMEMESSEIYERLLSKTAKIPMNTLIDRRFQDKKRPQSIRDEEILRIEKVTQHFKNLPLKINDKPNISVNEIRTQCRMIKDLGLIVVDYLQLMKSTKKHDNRNQEVGAISRELKILAAELGIPILCLSQLNRCNDEEKRPSPCDLRDSGEIEQNCSKLILMWCLEKNFNECGAIESKTIGVDVALNRRGASGVVMMNFNGNYMAFKELDRRYEEPKIKRDWR